MGCQGGCSGCHNSLFVGDWLEGVRPSREAPPLVEVRFKGNRRELFWTELDPLLATGEWVVVPEIVRRSAESAPQIGRGYDVGCVQLTGHLAYARLKSLKLSVEPAQKVIRRASEADLAALSGVRLREPELLRGVRRLVEELGLGSAHQMKVTDVELTADSRTLICYFTAEGRVDFRELIRCIADTFRVRPEMRQISAREDTARLGGIGPCGRELCCSSWMVSLPTVGTEAARYQGLSLNSTKITGLCGKLKCCLNYELDAYKNALSRIPKVKYLYTDEGEWRYLRTEILLERLWFEKVGEGGQVCLSVDAVRAIMQMNAQNQKPPSIEPYTIKFPNLPTRI
ncbi:MAG: hypothetical protein N2170_00050 [Bacteroidia bacterium]|nr:hypothetical protein [Bacteroidia bacterium]